jgi:hypothetical protein
MAASAYRRVADTLGVCHTELALPDAMRQLDVGAYSVPLPVLGVDICTNGDFQVDLGFPWNQVFTRFFSIQGFVPRGVPVPGSGGCYCGKLSGAVVGGFPQATAPGRFNPAQAFGFGLQVGVGKAIEKGVLRAGFRVTVFGILEGRIARWGPARPGAESAGDRGQLQGEYCSWLQGTVGIIGRLVGRVDFAVIKAGVQVAVDVFARIAHAACANIPIRLLAAVDAVLAWVAQNGGRVVDIDAEDRQSEVAYPPQALMEANARHPLSAGPDLRIDGDPLPGGGDPARRLQCPPGGAVRLARGFHAIRGRRRAGAFGRLLRQPAFPDEAAPMPHPPPSGAWVWGGRSGRSSGRPVGRALAGGPGGGAKNPA